MRFNTKAVEALEICRASPTILPEPILGGQAWVRFDALGRTIFAQMTAICATATSFNAAKREADCDLGIAPGDPRPGCRLLREALNGEGAEFRVLVADFPCVFELIRISPHLHRVKALKLVDGHPRAR